MTDEALISGHAGPLAVPDADAEVLAETLLLSLEDPAPIAGRVRPQGVNTLDGKVV